MIRPFSLLCMLSAAGAGMYLYTEKHRAELLDRQISRVMHETEAARQRVGLLRADWALLNDPTRLQDMADKYLALKPMAPTQFVQLADLSSRLPAPVAAPPTGGTDAEDVMAQDAPPADAAEDGAATVTKVASANLAPKAAPPVKPPAKLVAHAAPKRAPHPVALAEREPPMQGGPMAPSSPLPLASPQPPRARVMSAMARPGRMAARPAVVSAVPAQIGASPYVGSALGGRSYVPPPVPFGAQ